jgi:hypothetical protein
MIEWAVQHFFNREWGKKGIEPTFFLGFFTANAPPLGAKNYLAVERD